jgi:hypothetical protein
MGGPLTYSGGRLKLDDFYSESLKNNEIMEADVQTQLTSSASRFLIPIKEEKHVTIATNMLIGAVFE